MADECHSLLPPEDKKEAGFVLSVVCDETLPSTSQCDSRRPWPGGCGSCEDRPVRKERGRKPEGTISPWAARLREEKNLGARVIQMCHNDLQMRNQGNSESWLTVTSSHTGH